MQTDLKDLYNKVSEGAILRQFPEILDGVPKMLNHTYNPSPPPKSVLAVFKRYPSRIEDSPALALCVEIAEHAGLRIS